MVSKIIMLTYSQTSGEMRNSTGELLGAGYAGEKSEPASLDRLEALLDRGDFDLVAVGRALLQDPAWVVKIREGRHHELSAFDRSAMVTLF